MRKIILCADDYSQNMATTVSIIKLLEKQRISAISCLTNNANWAEHGLLLKPYLNNFDIGLHFNLTDNYSLSKLLLKSKLHLLKQREIEAEFMQQLADFVQVVGKLPDFIDGHQHIHQLPIICDAIVNNYNAHLINQPYVRHVTFNKTLKIARLKQFIIHLVSDNKFRKKLHSNAIPHNQSFSGIYNFRTNTAYHELFPSFLQAISHGGLIMCHPELEQESSYFLSDKFTQELNAAQIEICRFQDIAGGNSATPIFTG